MRRLRWSALVLAILAVVTWALLRHQVNTLRSVRRVPGGNAYVMDYYVEYPLDSIRRNGVDVTDLEGSFVRAYYPAVIVPIVEKVKRWYLPNRIHTLDEPGAAHHCSTLTLRSKPGRTFFARNLDYGNDACLIVRVHDRRGVASVSVIDLAYLNLNRADLDQTSLLVRLPLLFAPYYVMDGMNRHGVAVADMSVPAAQAPSSPGKPSIIQSTLMRLILDQARSVDEALQIIDQYNVHFVQHPEHLMIADATGRSVVVEFVESQVRVTESSEPWQVCTNHLICDKTEEENDATCPRYRAGSDGAAVAPPVDSLDDAQALVRRMSVDNWTMWTSVYDLNTLQLRVLYKSRPDVRHDDQVDQAGQ